MSTFIRSQHNSSWIGYETKATKPQNVQLVADGEQVQKQLYPEVYVREFTSVKIKAITRSDHEGRGGTRSVSVTFDAASVVTGSEKKLKHDFFASTIADSELHTALQSALESGTPVYVGIETRRRYKSKGGEVIPYDAPINELRGANPDGTHANSNMTGDNCGNAIAVAGPAADATTNLLSSEAKTDPTKWELFRNNRDGSMPPEGFRRIVRPGGEPGGAIVAADNAPAAAGGDAKAIAAEVAKILSGSNDSQDATVSAPAVRGARSVEGKPWEVYNSDGRLNPASYLSQSVRWARRDAIDVLAAAALDAANVPSDEVMAGAATDLVKPILDAAGYVQEQAVGYRKITEGSFREAAKWFKQVADTEKPFQLEWINDAQATTSWATSVASIAADLFVIALQYAAEYAEETVGPGVAQVDTSRDGAQQATEQSQDRQQTSTEQPQTAEQPQATETLADRADLQNKWDELIVKINLTNFPERLNPILVKNFGTYQSTSIPAGKFERMVTAGLSQPEKFFEAAKAAAQNPQYTDAAA